MLLMKNFNVISVKMDKIRFAGIYRIISSETANMDLGSSAAKTGSNLTCFI